MVQESNARARIRQKIEEARTFRIGKTHWFCILRVTCRASFWVGS